VGQVKSGKWKNRRVAGLAASWHLPGDGLNILVLLVATSAPQGLMSFSVGLRICCRANLHNLEQERKLCLSSRL